MSEAAEAAVAPKLDAGLVELAIQCKVSEGYRHILVGFDDQLFVCIASDSSSLDEAPRDLLEGSEEPSTAQRLLLLSALRLLCESCRNRSSAGQSGKRSDTSDSTSGHIFSSWSEQFPPKLSGEKVMSLQKSFHSRYPGEVLDPENFPYSCLLAYAAKVVQKGRTKMGALEAAHGPIAAGLLGSAPTDKSSSTRKIHL